MFFRQIPDESLAQYAYLIGCQRSGEAVVIDPERDVDRYVALAEAHGLRLVAAADTHLHADYLSGLRALAERGLRVYAPGEGGNGAGYEWLAGSRYDHHLLKDGDVFRVGNVALQAAHTPGHTPEHVCFLVTDHGGGGTGPMGLLSGDFVFVGDVGRPDLLESALGAGGAMEPSARRLYGSLRWFKTLPEWLQVWPGHGAGSACGKALGAVPQSTVGYELRHNAAVLATERGESFFVQEILDGQPEPPLYFARMKETNRLGPPLLDRVPAPPALPATALEALRGRTDVAVIDTRPAADFVRGHLTGALLAPFDKQFPTVAGSYVEPGLPVHLIARADQVEPQVRSLIRIGLDQIEGYFTPEVLAQAGPLERTETVSFADLEARRSNERVAVLDVRRAAEYAAGHVPAALHVAHTRLPDHLDALPHDRTLLVHCQSGVRAAVASALLARHGFRVAYVQDAFPNWVRAYGQPVEEAALAD